MNRICELLDIKYPIIQAGMIWCSGWRLASAVSQCGGLGVIGAGSMYPKVLEEHIQKYKQSCQLPFAINLPLLYPDINQHIDIIIKENVKIVITSAGNPSLWTEKLKSHGIKVIHVVSNTKFAKKCEEVGVDAIIAEGFEAGGHNGREETTTMCLIPMIKAACNLPIIAAGGIGSGQAIAAAMALGADAVQIGSLFASSEESSAHINFKNKIVETGDGGTELALKQLTPVRLIKNEFYQKVKQAENNCESKEKLSEILGRGRAKKGMFEGDLIEGELEIGQIAANIHNIKSAKTIFEELVLDYNHCIKQFKTL